MLLEIIVALSVAAIAIAALLGSFSGGLGGLRKTETRIHASLLAQSLLEQRTVGRHFQTGTTSGRMDGLNWRVDIAPYDARTVRDAAVPWQMFQVRVSVTSPDRHTIEMSALRLGRRQADARP